MGLWFKISCATATYHTNRVLGLRHGLLAAVARPDRAERAADGRWNGAQATSERVTRAPGSANPWRDQRSQGAKVISLK